MQRSTAEKLRLEWNGAVCEHSMFDCEYSGGTATGNYACLICGETFNIKKIQLLILLPFLLTVKPTIELLEIIQAILDTL